LLRDPSKVIRRVGTRATVDVGSDTRNASTRPHIEGDEIVWRITASGTHKGPFLGVPATGKAVKFGAHYTFRVENDKIVERWSTLDRLSLLMQLGVVSLPPK
jgi:hypothetical protein